jgi:hypothetical protein
MKRGNIRAVVVLTSFLLLAAPLSAREKTDVLVMKNGDRLTCEVKGLEAGVLYVKLDYVEGTISVQWSKVARLESSRLFIVKTENGSVYTGRPSTTAAPGDQPAKIQVAETPDKKVVIDRSQIVAMGRTSEKFWQRFNGDISTGIIYSKGNQAAQYNLSSLVEYPRERWAAQASFDSSLSSSTGATASTRHQLNFGALRLLRWNNYFYSGVASFLQSSEQGIGLQTNFGGGIGRYLKNTNRAKISMLGGLAWQRTKYDEPTGALLTTQNVTAAMIAADVKVFKFKKTRLNLSATLIPAISEPGRVYFRTNGSYYVKLFSNLSWNFSFYGSWDNRPPGRLSGSDYGTSSGLGWTFGNR